MTQQPPFGPQQPSHRPVGSTGGAVAGRQWTTQQPPTQQLPPQQLPPQQLSPQPLTRQPPPQHPIPQHPIPQRPMQQHPMPQHPMQQRPMQQHPFPAGTPSRFPVPGTVPPAGPVPIIRVYREPQWAGDWPARPSKSKSATIAGGIAVLVAAIVTAIALITQHSTTADPVSQGSQLPPTPISVTKPSTDDRPTDETTLDRTTQDTSTERATTTGETTAGDPTTNEESTEEPTAEPTAEPTTPVPTRTTTARTRTTSNGADPYRQDQQAATTVARAWATAVNNGDFDGVAALSCRQDQAAFESGASQNPASLAGGLTLKFQTVITARPKGIATFGVSPVKDGQSTLKTFVTMQNNKWLVCVTITKLSDL